MTDPTSRQRGRPQMTRQKLSTTKIYLWSTSPRLGSTPRHTDWLTVSCDVTLTVTLFPLMSSSLACGEAESAWYVGYCLAYCTGPGWLDDDCGAGENRTAPVSLCPPQIPHYLTWDQTQAAGRLGYGTASCTDILLSSDCSSRYGFTELAHALKQTFHI
jgi:hypothetical protein